MFEERVKGVVGPGILKGGGSLTSTHHSYRTHTHTMVTLNSTHRLLRSPSPPVLHLIRTARLDILTQLHLEESLFRHTSHDWLLVNDGVATPAVVLGISGKASALVHEERARAMGVPLIRRFTGGGTVVVDENSVMTSVIVGPGVCDDVKRFPKDVMRWTHGLLFGGGGGGGGEKPSTVRSRRRAISLLENDFTIGTRKVGGNAQAISGQRFLQHTSFLWDYREALMGLLKEPVKRPAYRGDRSHGGFVATLREEEGEREEGEGEGEGEKETNAREAFVDEMVSGCVVRGGWGGVVEVGVDEALGIVDDYRAQRATGRQVLLGSVYL